MMITDRNIGDIKLAPIGLGCMSLSHAYLPKPDEADGERLVHHAIDIGYNHFDSARIYGRGQNEALLSRILKTRRDEMFITSKCGIEFKDGKRRIDCRPSVIKNAVDKSLQTLGVESIDLYYLHRRDINTPIEESVGTLADLQRAGKIGAIGLSEMSANTVKRAHKETPIAALQSEYSLWTRNPEISVLKTCADLGIAFVAFSPLARGALAGRLRNPENLETGDLRLKHPRFNSEHWQENIKLIDAFNALAEEAGVTSAQLSLAWVLSLGDHIHVIPGTGSIEHLEENFNTGELNIAQDIFDRASALINQTTVSGPRYPEGAQRDIDTEEFEPC
jgi:aryl-alcohol dehydrogenase-like predicted oxidoreductase